MLPHAMFSQYLLRCQALTRPLFTQTHAVFESAFREFGLPQAIRTDAGAPFSTLAAGGLSRLAVVDSPRHSPGAHHAGAPGSERSPRTHAQHLESGDGATAAAQLASAGVRDLSAENNHERPHEALADATPASHYLSSPRLYPRHLPPLEYPAHFRLERAYPNGVISFRGTQWYLSNCLAGELVGLEEVARDRWKVYFGAIELGLLDVQNAKARGARQFGLLLRTDGTIVPRRPRCRRVRR
jgi:hypothetical protein